MQLPEYYFRTRENGAAVYLVITDERGQRLEMQQIAVANHKNGEIKAHGDHTLTTQQHQAVQDWIENRRKALHDRDIDDIRRSIDHLSAVAHWSQTKATDEDLEAITDELLLAMHDLRSVLVRKKMDRIAKDRRNAS